VTSSWFFLSTLNYDARSTIHQIQSNSLFVFPLYSALEGHLKFYPTYRGTHNYEKSIQNTATYFRVRKLLQYCQLRKHKFILTFTRIFENFKYIPKYVLFLFLVSRIFINSKHHPKTTLNILR